VQQRSWIVYTALLVLFWGVWGAFSSLPTQFYGYPDQMVYVIWSITMLIPCLVSLRGAAFDRSGRAARYGLAIGLTGAGGQLLLFKALTIGPAYLIFPVISVSPAITVLMAFAILRERVAPLGWAGVAIALVAIVLLSIPSGAEGEADAGAWLVLSAVICVAWGVQAFLMKRAAVAGINDASIFGWMTISGLLLVPFALLAMSGDAFGYPFAAPALATATQLLNAVGALFLVMALSRGKAVIVAPCTNALAPVLTIAISLVATGAVPSVAAAVGILLAIVGSTLMVYSEERDAAVA
jgi:drug/metabolite transporter (DMT)-like permease